MAIVKGFFSSPFSVNHANLQVFVLLASGMQVMYAHMVASHIGHSSVCYGFHYSFCLIAQLNTLCTADKPVDLHQAAPVVLQDL